MAESAFDFNQAPSGAGRQFGVLAGALGLKSGKSREPKGMTAKDQSALMAQQHGHNMELESHKAGLAQQNAVMSSVVGHVIGEEAAAAGHKRTMALNRQTHKLGEASAESAHMRGMEAAGQAHSFGQQNLAATQGHEINMANLHHENGLNAISEINSSAPNVASYKSPSGASIQFNEVK